MPENWHSCVNTGLTYLLNLLVLTLTQETVDIVGVLSSSLPFSIGFPIHMGFISLLSLLGIKKGIPS